MNLYMRIANRRDLYFGYLNDMNEFIKRFDVILDLSFKSYLRNTYNTIKDMFITQGLDGYMNLARYYFTLYEIGGTACPWVNFILLK